MFLSITVPWWVVEQACEDLKFPKKPAPLIFPTANYEYNPKVGDLVLFPGQIQHEVKPVEGERIMISGNLVVDYDTRL